MPNPDQIPYVNQIRRLTDIDDIRKVPVLGDYYGAMNSVIDYFESECHPDWWVYVETLFPALGEAVVTYMSFGLDDILRGYFRPAGGRGFGGLGRSSRRLRRPTRAQRARGLLRGGIPEIGELVGRNLPGSTAVRSRRQSGASQFLWRVDGLAQRALWHWMVADITEDFVSNWTSSLYRSDQCNDKEVGGIVRAEDTVGTSGHHGFAAMPVVPIVEEWGSISATTTSLNVPAGFTGSINFSGSPRGIFPPFGEVTLQVALDQGGGVVKSSGPPKLNPETGRFESMVNVVVPGGRRYVWGTSNTGGIAAVDDVEVVAMVTGNG